MDPSKQPYVLWVIWAILIVDMALAVVSGKWNTVLIALVVLFLTVLPQAIVSRFAIRLPSSFVAFIGLFVFGTLFLGEVYDFYERYWWWDVVLHFGSALAFGLIGFLFIFALFEGDRYAAPPIAIAFYAFCFAVTVGTLWEIFEFAVDQAFGTNMQKSGLPDTMGDLIVDGFGAFLGAGAGFLYLKGWLWRGMGSSINAFLRLNRGAYRKFGRGGRHE